MIQSQEVTQKCTDRSHTLRSSSLDVSILHCYSTISTPYHWHAYDPQSFCRDHQLYVYSRVCVCVCVSMVLGNFITRVALHNHHHREGADLFHHVTSSQPGLLPPPKPQPLATSNLFSIFVITTFQEYYISGTIQYVTI